MDKQPSAAPESENLKPGQKVRGAGNGKWRGGVHINSTGHLRVSAGPQRGRYVHQLVAEAMLGRPLRRDEEVHHVNNNKKVLPKTVHGRITRKKDNAL